MAVTCKRLNNTFITVHSTSIPVDKIRMMNVEKQANSHNAFANSVEGAFVQALSLWTLEDTVYDEKTGALYNYRTWNYKIFGAKDIPNDYRIYLSPSKKNPVGVLGSKAVSEPSTTMGYVIVGALRDAIKASRHDSGYSTDVFLNIGVPVTNENVVRAADVKIDEYLLY